MSIQALNWVMNQDSIDNSGARFVLLVLANYADENGYCYPSRETLARKTSLSVRAVQNHLNWLVEHQYIRSIPRRHKDKISTILYFLLRDTDQSADSAHSQSENSAHCRSADSAQRNGSHCADLAHSQSAESAHNTFVSDTKEKNFIHHTTTQEKPGAAACADSNPKSKIQNPKSKCGSQFSLSECLRYVNICVGKGEQIRNPKGLANHLFQTGNADAFILATLYPDKNKEIEEEIYGPPRKFTDEPCTKCFGAKMANPDGKGYRACRHCQNEKGKSTGKEPFPESDESIESSESNSQRTR